MNVKVMPKGAIYWFGNKVEETSIPNNQYYTGSVTYNKNNILCNAPSTNQGAILQMNTLILKNKFSKLCGIAKGLYSANDTEGQVYSIAPLMINRDDNIDDGSKRAKDSHGGYIVMHVPQPKNEIHKIELDISDAQSDYYVYFGTQNLRRCEWYAIWLER